MRNTIAIGFVAAALLSLAPSAFAAPGDFLFRSKQAPAFATPIPKLQLAACRFWQCNCRRECIVYEGSRCVQTYQTCDTCSKCDD